MKSLLRRAGLFAATLGLAVSVAGTAGAQVSRALTVAVLTFTNSSGVGGPLMGSRASAAVETQLIESGRYDVVKKDLVTKTMSDLNLTPPLGRLGITQLAQALEADDVITGDVQKVTRDAKTGQVRVTLRVEMTDRASGELSNGAIVTGESGIRPDFSGGQDVLLDEAINKAAFAGVRSMNERILPEGTVFATSTREGQIEALLNIGSNSGVRPGMEFIVLRNREQVGRLRVTATTPTDATAAVITTTRGVQPEDKVRAIFRLENIPVELGGSGESASRIARPKADIGNMAIGVLALAGLYSLSHGKNSSGSPGPRDARAFATGPYNGAPGSDVLGDVPVVHVTWRPPIGVNTGDILGYQIFSDRDTVNPLASLDGAARDTYIDGRYTTGTAIATAPLATSTNSPGPDVGRPMQLIIRSAYNKTSTGGTSGGTGGTGGGTTTTTATLLDDVRTGMVTFLIPPIANTTATPASDVSAIPFNFQTVPGGDRYVVQLSTNPTFANATQYPSDPNGYYFPPPPSIGPLSVLSSSTTGGTATFVASDWVNNNERTSATYTVSKTEDIRLFLAQNGITNLATQPVYWRVGVRDSRDSEKPENGGWVWGTPAILGATTTGAIKGTGPVVTAPVVPTTPSTPGSPKPAPTPGDIRGSRGSMGRGGAASRAAERGGVLAPRGSR